MDSYPDLFGLAEGVVDSDDESDEISQLSAGVQATDPLRDSLGKKPADRTPADVEVKYWYNTLVDYISWEMRIYFRIY